MLVTVNKGVIPILNLCREFVSPFFLTENITHKQNAVNPCFGALLKLGLNNRDADFGQSFDCLCREERAGDDDVRRLGNDRLRVARDLGYVLNQRGHVRIGRILRRSPYSNESVYWHQRHGHFVVSNGSGNDPLWLGRDAHNSVQSLDFAGPAEVGRINDSSYAL